MCTIALLFDTHPEARLVAGLNRDEWKERPTDAVHSWPTDANGEASIVAGRDRKSGGAWFAIGPRVFTALTNDRGAGAASPRRLSRGQLVVDGARAANVAAALEPLRAIDPGDYGPFHLLLCDGSRLVCASNSRGQIAIRDVAPGVHVLGNFGLDNPEDPVVQPLRQSLGESGHRLPLPALHKRLQSLLREEGEGRPHVDYGPYGTRSSATLSLWPRDRREGDHPVPEALSGSLWVTDTSPRDSVFEDRSRLLG